MTEPSCPVCKSGAIRLNRQLGQYALYQCAECQLVFAPNSFGVEVDYSSIYETPEYIQEQVDSIGKQQNLGAFAEIITYRPFFREVSVHKGKTLLDVGCGVGRFCQGAHANGWDVCGIDVSKTAIETGKRFAKFPMQVSTLQEMVDGGRRFDVVTAFEVLEHLDDPVAFIRQCAEVVMPGGELFFTVPNWDCKEAQEATRSDLIPPVHVLFFTLPSLRRAISEAGLTIQGIGHIRSDVYPGFQRLKPLLKWIKRRLKRRPNPALGLWIHASRAYTKKG